ncbi:MAG: HEAT repeat domain-containing protein [Candidatus Heimdallarchaeaceae archaeon]
MIKTLGHEEESVRVRAVKALEALEGKPYTIEALKKALDKEENYDVRNEIEVVLMLIE